MNTAPDAEPAAAAPLRVLRVVVVACQALTLLMTWPLWQPRVAPPLLPWFPVAARLAAVPFGVALLVSLGAILLRPRAGIAVHGSLLALAIAGDTTRFQPQCLSLAFLLVATLPGRGAALFGTAHLASLWLWSGLHKLLSAEYVARGSVLVTDRFAACPEGLARALALTLAALEVGLGIWSLGARTRLLARGGGAALHVGVVLWLSPLVLDWNESVLPWNAALAFAAWILLAPPRTGAVASFAGTWRDAPRLARLVAAAELALPAGFQAGVVPAPLAHALYSMSTPHALWHHADGRVTHLGEEPDLGVLLPAVEATLIASFRAQARSGDVLTIVERRALLRALGRDETVIRQE